MGVSLLVAGDYAPYARLANNSDNTINHYFDEVKEVLNNSDYCVVNLEAPLCSSGGQKIFKQGPALLGELSHLELLKKEGFNCVTLANNHILDFGDGVLEQTINQICSVGLDYVGAGMNIMEASSILFKNLKGINIALMNCCEHEFSIVTDAHGGANPLNPISQYYQIRKAKEKADYVIIIIHGGVEHYQYPTQRMVDTYRFFIDVGVDAVINHHQHCPCGFEIYKGKPIYYGLGNFCFDWDGKRDSIWNLGYMVKLNLGSNHSITSEMIPYRQCDETPSVHLLEDKELDDFNRMMRGVCDAIQNPDILVAKLKEFNEKNDYLYRKMLEPYSGRIANGLYRRGWLPSTISKERLLALMDFLICESHHERVKELLERLYKQYFNE